jgi:CHAT domain-containing protein
VKKNRDNEEILTRYLLGALSDYRMRGIEKRYFTDDDFYEEMRCAETDLIDRYARGELSMDEKRRFEEHFLSTPARLQRVRFARALHSRTSPASNVVRAAAQYDPQAAPAARWFSSPYLIAAASVIVLICAGLAVRQAVTTRSGADQELARGLEALRNSVRQERHFESRVSGFYYARYANYRGELPSEDRRERNLAQALILQSNKDDAEHHHAAGQLYITQLQFDDAIKELEAALASDPDNAQIYNDLGAALLEKARGEDEGGEHDRLLAESLKNFNRAIQLDDSLLEAHFNRALCSEEMNLPNPEQKWQEYLNRETDPQWRQEATRKIDTLKEQQKRRVSLTNEEVLRDFIACYQARDDECAWEVINHNREAMMGKLVWWQLLDSFYKLSAEGRHQEAGEKIRQLQYAGEMEARQSGDRFVAGLAQYCGSLSAERIPLLARAHTLVKKGHKVGFRSKYDKALKRYEEARRIFEQAGNRWEALYAGYWIGFCHLTNANKDESLAALQEVARASEDNGFKWLLAQSLTSLGNAHYLRKEYSQSVEHTRSSLVVSEEMKDYIGTQRNLAQLTLEYLNLHNHDEALRYMNRCLESASRSWPGAKQMYNNYEAAAQVFTSVGLYDAAAEFASQILELALNDLKDPTRIYFSYVTLGTIYGRLGNYDEGRRLIELGLSIASTFPEKVRQNREAYSLLSLGDLNRRAGDFAEALDCYSRAIDDVRLPVYSYEARKGKFLCYLAQQDYPRAKEELQAVLELAELYRAQILEEQNQNSFFDVEQDIYDLAIDFEYSIERDPVRAYEHSEQSRGRSLLEKVTSASAPERDSANAGLEARAGAKPLTLAELQGLLPRDVQILQYAALKDKLLTWVISANPFSHHEQNIGSAQLQEAISGYLNLLSIPPGAGAEELTERSKYLYNILISPVESSLDKNKALFVVPDKSIAHVPFPALIAPSGEYLIKNYRVEFVPSSSLFALCTDEANKKAGKRNERLLAVGDPRFDRKAFELSGLRSAKREAEQVARLYHPRLCLTDSQAKEGPVKSEMERADVIHLASHYVVNERFSPASKLLLAAEADQALATGEMDGVLEAQEIYGLKLSRARLVVLSACRTGVERFYNGEGMIGMARTFLARRVPLVVASLWRAESESTSSLMINFHRYRKQVDGSTLDALRRAQLDMIDGPDALYSHPHYWAPFVVIGGRADF